MEVVSINQSTKLRQSDNQNKADLAKRIHEITYEQTSMDTGRHTIYLSPRDGQ